MRFVPYPYQLFAIQKILSNAAIGLFLEMGLGKTVSTLTAIDILLYDRLENYKVLVIAPKLVAQETWSAEAAKWDHLRHLRISKVLGSKSQRARALTQDADIYVINRENIPWLVNLYGDAWPFDMVVIDELSSFKSPSRARFKKLRSVRKHIRRVVGLTGTPKPKGLLDLWPQLYLLDQGRRLGRTFGIYRDAYFKPDKRNGAIIYSWKPLAGAEDTIYSKISDICVSMKSADWIAMPERLDVQRKIALSPAAAAAYRRMEKELLLPLQGQVIAAPTASTLVTKLLQMANGAVYDDRGEPAFLHNDKLDALSEIVEDANGEPVLVFYSYKHDLARLQERFPEARVLKTAEDIHDWNAGRIELMLTHPASTGHGLNLQAGGHIIVWFGLPWSLELYQQANARLYRNGQQSGSVIIHHLIAEGTMDENVMEVLTDKAERQDALMEAVKARIDAVKD